MIEIYKKSFTESQWQYIIDNERMITVESYSGLTNESSDILNHLLTIKNTDDLLEYIDDEKHKLSKSKRTKQQQYCMLLITEQM